MPSMFNARDAANYEKLMGRWSRRLAPLFIEHAGIADREAVLEIGCGTGSLTFALGTIRGTGQPDRDRPFRDLPCRGAGQGPRRAASASSRATGARCGSPTPASTARCRCWCCPRCCRNPRRWSPRCAGSPGPAGSSPPRSGIRPVAAPASGCCGIPPPLSTKRPRQRATARCRARSTPRRSAADVGRGRSCRDRPALIDDPHGFRRFCRLLASPLRAAKGRSAPMPRASTAPSRDRLERSSPLAYLTGRPDGERSFVAVALSCRGVVPHRDRLKAPSPSYPRRRVSRAAARVPAVLGPGFRGGDNKRPRALVGFRSTQSACSAG